MTDRDKAVELLARALAGDNETMWAYRLAHCAECRERAQDYRNDATAILDQIAPLLTAQAVEADRMACTEELRLAVAAEREQCAKVAEPYLQGATIAAAIRARGEGGE
jgi:hypothetical protein